MSVKRQKIVFKWFERYHFVQNYTVRVIKVFRFSVSALKATWKKMHIWKTECRSGPLALVFNEILQNCPELESLSSFISLRFHRDHLRVKTTQKERKEKKRKNKERKQHLICQELITWKIWKCQCLLNSKTPPTPNPMFWPSDEFWPWAIRSSYVTLTFPKHNLLRVLNS